MTSLSVTFRSTTARFAFLLLGAALALALLLVFGSANSAPGCGQGCSSVLASKWSSVFGVPVGLLGALSYGAVLICFVAQRTKWLFEIASALVLGAALWFGVLQLVVLRAFCPWCCLTHACAVAGVFLLWLSPRSRVTGPPSWGPVALACVVMALFIALQAASSERAAIKLASVGKTSLETDAVSGRRTLTVHDGGFEIDVSSLPILGSVTADELIVALTDYTCSHCRQLHQSLERVQDSLGAQFGVVSLPAVRGKASREIHRLMLALYRAKPEEHARISRELFHESIPATSEALLPVLDGVFAKGELSQHLAEHHDWIERQFALTKEILAANKAKVETDNLPQLIIGSDVLVGASKDDAKYYTLLKDKFGLERFKAARLEFVRNSMDLGEVFAGTGREVRFEFANVGNQSAEMKGMRMPKSWRVLEAPQQHVAPGESASFRLMAAMPLEGGVWEDEIGFLSTALEAETKLSVKANVRKLLEVAPLMFDFKTSVSEIPESQTVRISLQEPVALEQPVSSSPWVDLELKTITDFQEYELVATPTQALERATRLGVILPMTPSAEASNLWPSAMQVPLVVVDEGKANSLAAKSPH